ncbi:hypothetical protein MMC27_003887 [Xylographa pallens]|nr:hypothetical protein [Xylographa pallens]
MALVTPVNFGPDGWKGNEECHSLLSMSATRCNNNTDWYEVTNKCSKLRTGVPCTVSSRSIVGWQYLSKLIDFNDGVRWVIHVPLDYTGPGSTACVTDRMSRKVATYKFLKQNTAIPVPDVHGYSVNIDPSIKSPYILLTHINGTLAASLDDYPEISSRIQEQLIKIMTDLASHKFDKIGSLALDKDGQYHIEKDMNLDAGPFKTAEEYYNALSIHHFHDFTKYHFRDNVSAEKCPALHLPFMFNNYMRIYTDCANDYGPFSLVYPGLGACNIVLDSENNIICVNDVDNIMAAPIPFVAQLPRIYVLNLPPPGLNTTASRQDVSYENRVTECARFVRMFKAEEERRDPLTPIANSMLSDGARLVEGLNEYGQMSMNCSSEWVQSYLYMYYRRQAGTADAKEFSKILVVHDDKEVETPADASSSTGPYFEREEFDELEAEPESPLSPIVPKRKHIATHLGLTEAQQEDIMHMHRALQMDSAQLVSDRTVGGNPQIKPSMYDHHSILQRSPIGEVVDKRLVRKESSSWLGNFLRSANKPLVSLQQPTPVKIARMRSLRKAFSSDSFRTTLAIPKALDKISLVPMPGRFPVTELEQSSREQTTCGARDTVGKGATDESDSVAGEVAGLALNDDGETYYDAAVMQGEHGDSGIYDEAQPLL